MAQHFHKAQTVLRRKSVEKRCGVSRSWIYAHIATGTFPKPIRLGVRAVGWLESEIEDWLNGKIQDREEVSNGLQI